MLRRAILLSLVLSCLAHGIRGHTEENADVAAFMHAAMASLRTAASYGRTGNVGLAQLELDDARTAWARLAERSNAPSSAQSFAALIATGHDRLKQADEALAAGDGARAAAAIAALRQSLHAFRREAGVVELSDCVFGLSPVMNELRNAAIRFAAGKADAGDVVQAGTALRERLQRCSG
ncbi:hypothetical protein, partial [Bradyrhizobium sp.]